MTTEAQQSALPAGFTARPATHDDFRAVFDLLIACDIADLGEPDYEEADLRDDWRIHDTAVDTRVLVSADGSIVGYAGVSRRNPVDLAGQVFIPPPYRGRGFGTWLTRWTERRASEHVPAAPEGARVTVAHGTPDNVAAAHTLLQHEGYDVERYFLRMLIDLDAPPPAPVLAPGVSIRTFVSGQDDHATYEAVEESFRDHWGHIDRGFDDFRLHALEREQFDPSLWFLATDGKEIAAIALCANFLEMGWVNTLGVRRPWRKTGLGLALLHHAFGEFHARQRNRIGLGVDAQSLTGATRLYERAGMHEYRRYALYRKELRAGVDLGVQAIAD
ncbi:MAG TPA: GNAT family N-acetyltransferase [Dehalococcoidia bacterium]